MLIPHSPLYRAASAAQAAPIVQAQDVGAVHARDMGAGWAPHSSASTLAKRGGAASAVLDVAQWAKNGEAQYLDAAPARTSWRGYFGQWFPQLDTAPSAKLSASSKSEAMLPSHLASSIGSGSTLTSYKTAKRRHPGFLARLLSQFDTASSRTASSSEVTSKASSLSASSSGSRGGTSSDLSRQSSVRSSRSGSDESMSDDLPATPKA